MDMKPKITPWSIAKDLAEITSLGVDEAHDALMPTIRKFGFTAEEAEEMSDPKKWWLISDEDVQLIKKGLTVPNLKVRARALHTLESGLHKTDAIPDDWKGD